MRVERPHPHYAWVTFDNPPRNQLSAAGRQLLGQALDELAADEDVRCLVVTGSGRSFTAGHDLQEDPVQGERDLSTLFTRVEGFRTPVVAAVNGAAVGGGLELALSCDLRIASADAVFVAAGVNVGLIANFYRLPRIVGEGPAKDLLLTGRRWSAEEALRWGLVTSVHPPEELAMAAHTLAERIATRAPLSVEATKDAVHRVRHAPADEAATLQRDRLAALFATDDHREALAAFFGKRPAVYRRR